MLALVVCIIIWSRSALFQSSPEPESTIYSNTRRQLNWIEFNWIIETSLCEPIRRQQQPLAITSKLPPSPLPILAWLWNLEELSRVRLFWFGLRNEPLEKHQHALVSGRAPIELNKRAQCRLGQLYASANISFHPKPLYKLYTHSPSNIRVIMWFILIIIIICTQDVVCVYVCVFFFAFERDLAPSFNVTPNSILAPPKLTFCANLLARCAINAHCLIQPAPSIGLFLIKRVCWRQT